MSITHYAKALFERAKEQNKTDVITFHFEDFNSVIEKHPDWVKLLDSPMIAFDEKVKMIDMLEYDVSFLAFIKTLAQKHLLYKMHGIYHEWVYLSRIDRKIAHLHIYTARSLSDQMMERLKKTLQPRFPNQTLEFHITIDPELIGGLKIVYQGQSLDRSVARELEELYTTI